ncbi:MAG: osmotically inducible protein OsmC [Planctomycetes bacterium TMED75]|nr:osmotically inducible protein OsmC [Planctomycetaceae bacterium]OUU95091.1 MAG: osmotically inducible protein OsmC [Planctomycetes bacterium TMED75]
MVTIHSTYLGDLRTESKHGPSGTRIHTDAPIDNQGKGESFSPTDLVATAVGTCMLTIMGIVAARHEWDIAGATAEVKKIMAAAPERRIQRIEVTIKIPGDGLEERARRALQKAAESCPVHATLGTNVEMPIELIWC